MTKNIFDRPGRKHTEMVKKVRLTCYHRVANALQTYCKSPAHTMDILKGKWHLAQQISRVKNKAVKEFSEQVVDHMDLAKMQLPREYVVRHLRLWLRRQRLISLATTHSLTSIGPDDIPA